MGHWTSFVGVGGALAACIWLVKRRSMRIRLDRFMGVSVQYEVFVAGAVSDKRTVLVTGGNGFLGRCIVSSLSDKGLNVVVFDVTMPEAEVRLKNVTYIRGNILNLSHIQQALETARIDSVIHTASLISYLGIPHEAIWQVNVEGTRNLTEACARAGVRSFIYTSSVTVALDRTTRVLKDIDEEAVLPREHPEIYSRTKAAAERIVSAASNLDGMVACMLRSGSIFGRGDRVVSDRLVHGLDNFIPGDGSSHHDWVPVESVALAHVLAEESLATDPTRRRKMHGAAYYITNNEPGPNRDFMGAAPIGGDGGKAGGGGGGLSHWGHRRPKRLPMWLLLGLAHINVAIYTLVGAPLLSLGLVPSLIDFTQRTYTFSSARAARDFGYAPALTNAEAIRRLVEEAAAAGR